MRLLLAALQAAEMQWLRVRGLLLLLGRRLVLQLVRLLPL
jgi:hypothetical protein